MLLFLDGAFSLLEDFRVLDFSHNSIMGIDENTLVGINTSHIDLGYNNFRKMPNMAFRKLKMVTNLILDGNLFQTLETGCLHSIRVRFLSISHSKLLDRLDKGSLTNLPLLETLTINHNPSLTYIHPGAVSGVPQLTTFLINNNKLSALEDFRPHIPSLRKLDLNGNQFECHCSLRWVQNLIRARDRLLEPEVRDGTNITCGEDKHSLFVEQISEQECQPFILPLFPESSQAVIGHNITWLCKTAGFESGSLAWSIPHGHMLGEGECFQDRHCVHDGKLFLVFAHPEDGGEYSCAAKNKYGNSSRKVYLEVKVNVNSIVH